MVLKLQAIYSLAKCQSGYYSDSSGKFTMTHQKVDKRPMSLKNSKLTRGSLAKKKR